MSISKSVWALPFLALTVLAHADDVNQQPSSISSAQGSLPVIPAVHDWRPANGVFSLKQGARILVMSDRAATVASTLQGDMRTYLNADLSLTSSTSAQARKGDVILELDSACPNSGSGTNAYEILIGDEVTIRGCDESGLFYGTRTLLQLFSPHEGQIRTVAKGVITDYSDFPQRGLLYDTARQFASAAYIRDLIRMLSFYKMNVLHLHLSDDEGFRLKLDAPQLSIYASKDGAYDRNDWQSFEKIAKQYHVKIIPEIDGPGHSGYFIGVTPSLGMGSNLNIINKAADGHLVAVDFTNALWDAFLPWVSSDTLHVGGDESDVANYTGYIVGVAKHLQVGKRKILKWNTPQDISEGYSVNGKPLNIGITFWDTATSSISETLAYKKYDVINESYRNYMTPYNGKAYYIGNGPGKKEVDRLANYWTPLNVDDGYYDALQAGGTDYEYSAPESNLNGSNPAQGRVLGGIGAIWNDEFSIGTVEDRFQMAALYIPAMAQRNWNATSPTTDPERFVDLVTQFAGGAGFEQFKFSLYKGPQRGPSLTVGMPANFSESTPGYIADFKQLIDTEMPSATDQGKQRLQAILESLPK